ncbi:DUF1266 domain-containing protein [Ureaplasma zalophigenitalium]|uniref:DUF1266 domain-containing protein n=1 Tax=Ureaplasma zalophigenitalium TaxID=907723 RepID=A0ABT3BNW3_9BACT|nr:DUF1266 domain-containing protein [Ureaplasma zalophigenitalium]MCV3753922.1 DUF1266 domain-containing protein [Ureaplasma zalophigenitalium]
MLNQSIKNKAFIETKIRNYNEHVQAINHFYNLLSTSLSNIFKQQKLIYDGKQKTEQIKAIVKLADVFFMAEGIVDLQTNVYEQNIKEPWFANTLKSFLSSYFEIGSDQETYLNELNKNHGFNNDLDVASLFLIYDLQKEYDWYTTLGYKDFEGFELDYLMVDLLKTKVNVHFMMTKNVIQNVFLLKIGKALNYIDEDTFESFIWKNFQIIKQQFVSLEDFYFNYIVSVCYEKLNKNNPNRIIALANAYINVLEVLYDASTSIK